MVFGNDDADVTFAHIAEIGPDSMKTMAEVDRTNTPGTLKDDEMFVRRDLLGVVLAQTPIAAFGNLTVAGVTWAVLAQWEPASILGTWTGVIATLVLARLLLQRRMTGRLAGLDRGGVEKTERILTVLVGLTGLTWGLPHG